MSDDPAFLTIEHVMAIHTRMMAEFGGEPSIRDSGLLEAAVMMPMAQFDGALLHEGIHEMAAAYLFHICKNHAFADGNKRTALTSAEVFIRLNGGSLTATDDELERLTRSVAEGGLSKDEVTAFFREKVDV